MKYEDFLADVIPRGNQPRKVDGFEDIALILLITYLLFFYAFKELRSAMTYLQSSIFKGYECYWKSVHKMSMN